MLAFYLKAKTYFRCVIALLLIIFCCCATPSTASAQNFCSNLLLKSKQTVNNIGSTLKVVDQYLRGQESVFHFNAEIGFTQKLLRAIQEVSRAFLRTASPIPLPFLRTPTEPIFEKQWRQALNGELYNPTDNETKILEEYHAKERFFNKSEFIRTHPKWSRFRNGIGLAGRTVVAASLLLAANLAHEASAHLITADEYLHDTHYTLASDEIQVVVDLVPFPHLAVRIGSKVYSYGFTHLTSTPLTEYVQAKELQFIAKNRGLLPDEAHSQNIKTRLSHAVKSELEKLPRSLQVITIRLPQNERNALKRYLELRTANRYLNQTLANDCSTMIIRAFRSTTSIDVSPLIDPSPSMVAMSLAMQKTLGDGRFGPI